jgi:archaellum component FlaC
MSNIPEIKVRKHLHGKHYEPLRKLLERLLYPVDEDGNRLVDENNEALKVFPDGHRGCRYESGFTDRSAAEEMKRLNSEEYNYIKYTMVRAVRKENFGDIIYQSQKPEPVSEPTSEPTAAIIGIVEEYIIKLVNDCKGDIIKLVNDANSNIGNNTHRLNVQGKHINEQGSAINDHAQRLTNQANRLDLHAKQISATMEGDLKLAKQISELEKRIVELETHVMDIGKESAELASSFRSLQGKLSPISTSQDVGANGTNKAKP